MQISLSHERVVLQLIVLFAAGCSDQKKPSASVPVANPPSAAKSGMDMSHDHMAGQPGKLMVRTDPPEIKPGQPVKFDLMIHDAAGKMIMQFDTIHEKKVHLIIVRDALDFFAHVHPELDAMGGLKSTFTFPTPGTFWLYADHKPAGKDQTVAVATLTVAGTPPEKPPLTPNVPGKVTTEVYQANTGIENPKAGAMTGITFTLADLADKPVTDLQPYLGAMGHLVVISSDGKDYVHAHAAEAAAAPGVVGFMAHFPRGGLYKGWGQFQRAGVVHTVPFVMNVQ